MSSTKILVSDSSKFLLSSSFILSTLKSMDCDQDSSLISTFNNLCASSELNSRSDANCCPMGVIVQWGTASLQCMWSAAYSMSFFMYFFLGAFNKTCKDCQSIQFIITNIQMSELYREGGQHYRLIENPTNIGSGSQVRVIELGIPQHSRISPIQIGNTQYVPKIIESGYIVGPPVAYTQQPYLPNTYVPYSPNNNNVILQTSSHYPRNFSPVQSRVKTLSNVNLSPPPVHFVTSQTKQPQIIIHPSQIKEETVAKAQYERCVSECKNWETKYNELYLKYMNVTSQSNSEQTYLLKEQNNRLRGRIRQLQSRERNGGQNSKEIRQLIERYKQSTLKECYLLLDRYRLQSKIVPSKQSNR